MQDGPDAELERRLDTLNRGQLAAQFGPMLDELLSELEDATRKRVFRALDSPEGLDAQLAIQTWTEWRAYAKLRRTILHTEKRGRVASTQVAGDMPPITGKDHTHE